MFISNVLKTEGTHIATGEGKEPKSISNDDVCKEIAFPYLFPNRNFGYEVLREVKLSRLKYFLTSGFGIAHKC